MKKRPTANIKQPSLSFGSGETYAEIYTDGACRGNPGNSGSGIFIKDSLGTIHKIKKYLGVLTNNQAEYEALIGALEAAEEIRENRLQIYTDSLLLANQINGIWRVSNPQISVLHKKAKELISEFEQVKISHIPRELNREADKLANEAIDEYFA